MQSPLRASTLAASVFALLISMSLNWWDRFYPETGQHGEEVWVRKGEVSGWNYLATYDKPGPRLVMVIIVIVLVCGLVGLLVARRGLVLLTAIAASVGTVTLVIAIGIGWSEGWVQPRAGILLALIACVFMAVSGFALVRSEH